MTVLRLVYIDDMPRQGGFVVTVIANTGAPLSQVAVLAEISRELREAG